MLEEDLILSCDEKCFKVFFSTGDGGIMVSIAAFQAVDPGSIPGRRNIFSTSGRHQQEKNTILTFPKIYSIPGVQKGFPTPGIEPGPPG